MYTYTYTCICIYDISCSPGPGNYLNESIFVHEFAHSILEVGIAGAHSEWYDEFGRISDSFNSGQGSSICPDAYHCDRRELFAEASQIWFGVTTRTDVVQFISTPDEMRQVTVSDTGNTTSLYDFMYRIYGEPRSLCSILTNFPHCSSKCTV